MPKNIKPMNFPLFYINLVLFLIPLVQALLSKMAGLSANFVIFLMLFVLLLLLLLLILSFGGEAALTAFYTINRCPSPIVQNQPPYDLLFGSSPSYDLLRVFGCVCFVFLHDHERNKLQSCSRLCCFLRYGIGQKGYRCYDPISKRLRVSRHVVFCKHKMFYQLPHVLVSFIPSIDPLPDLFPEESPTSSSNIGSPCCYGFYSGVWD